MRATTFSICVTVDARLAFPDRLQPQLRAGLVDHIDGLVRHVTVIDVARRQLGGRLQRIVLVLDAVMLLVTRLQTRRISTVSWHRGFGDVDLLEAARQRVVLLEDAAVFLVGGRADAAQSRRWRAPA